MMMMMMRGRMTLILMGDVEGDEEKDEIKS